MVWRGGQVWNPARSPRSAATRHARVGPGTGVDMDHKERRSMQITSSTLVLALVMAMAGCAVTDDAEGDRSAETAAAITPTATSQLFVTSVGADTIVSSAGGVNTCPMASSCTFTYPAPTALSIDVKTIFSPANDCLRFV